MKRMLIGVAALAALLVAVVGTTTATAGGGEVIFGGQDQTICHATASENGGNQHNGYDRITVSVDSIVKDNGHGSHTDIGGKSDIIPAFDYTKTVKGHGHDPDVTTTEHFPGLGDASLINSGCGPVQPPEDVLVEAGVTFTDPTCESVAGVSYANSDKVTYEITSGSVAAGQSVTITAYAKDGFTLGEGQSVFTHTFPAAPTNCGEQSIPVTAGVTFTEATCTTGPSFHLVKTNPGLRFYDVEGTLVNGQAVAGETYTFTALPDEGYVVVGQSVFVHTFAAAPTDCGPRVCPDGQPPTPGEGAFDPNDDCKRPPPVTPPVVVPPTTVTPPVVTPPAVTPPVTVPPKAKPPVKVKPKHPKPKPDKPHVKKVAHKTVHICLPIKHTDSHGKTWVTPRVWTKGVGCVGAIMGSG